MKSVPGLVARSIAKAHIAEQFLRLAGYEVYCPRIRERGRARPLFPSYTRSRIFSGHFRSRIQRSRRSASRSSPLVNQS
jgi:hypothetical protein